MLKNRMYVMPSHTWVEMTRGRLIFIQMVHHVVKQLIEPYRHGGYNSTLDKVFIYHEKLAIECLSNNITIIGTIRNNRREVSANIAQLSHSTGLYTLSFESD